MVYCQVGVSLPGDTRTPPIITPNDTIGNVGRLSATLPNFGAWHYAPPFLKLFFIY